MLTFTRLVFRNLAYHRRGHLAVLLGVAVGAAVLTGSLLVGDSLRGSLRERAERQLNGIAAAYVGAKPVRAALAAELPGRVAPAFLVPASIRAAATDPEAEPKRIGRATAIGVDDRFPPVGAEEAAIDWKGSERVAALSHRVAARLGAKVGDRVEVDVEQVSSVPRSSLLGHRDTASVTGALRLTVAAVLPADSPSNDFSLVPSPGAAWNVFVPLAALQEAVGQAGRANALLSFDAPADESNAALRAKLTLDDWGLKVRRIPAEAEGPPGKEVPRDRPEYLSVESRQLVLDAASAEATGKAADRLGLRSAATSIYLANWIARERDIALQAAPLPSAFPYLADWFGGRNRMVPYSIVAAMDATEAAPLGPLLPPGSPPLADDEIVLTSWDQSPLRGAAKGEGIVLSFFEPEIESGEREKAALFRLRETVSLAGAVVDPTLSPPFRGITDKLSVGEWKPPFSYEGRRVRDRDEKYWENYRTTPKAFISLAAGRRLFGSRFGSITSVRVAPAPGETDAQARDRLAPALLRELDPAAAGLAFDPVRDRLLAASKGGTDFGVLFLGFSSFLIGAALMLVGLLFRLSLDRRAKEVGLLLACGHSVRRVRRMLLAEGLVVAAVGASFGAAAGLAFNAFMLDLLARLWPDPEVGTFLRPHATALSFGLGFGLTAAMALAALFLGARGLVRVPPPALLRGEAAATDFGPEGTRGSRSGLVVASAAVALGIGLVVGGGRVSNPDFRAMSFFSGGGMLLAAAMAGLWAWMKRARRGAVDGRGAAALGRLGARNAARNPLRSLLTASLLASAAFLLVAVESFRRRPERDFLDPRGGSGGFNLVAESSVPLFRRFDAGEGLDDLESRLQTAWGGSGANPRYRRAVEEVKGLAPAADGTPRVYPLRLRGGDDASCLNLYQATRPRLLGLPDDLVGRGGFQFSGSEAETAEEKVNPWLLLKKPHPSGAVPAIVEQNTAMWMLKTGIGGEVSLPDERGREVKFRIVGTLVDSPFQSELLLADGPFRALFPHSEGYRVFLIRTPPGREDAVAAVLDAGLGNYGFVATRMREKVAAYQAVIGAYLSTFQVLGGLGLLLGVLGLAAVILRGVWERLGELALLRAFGYRARALHVLVLAENVLLLFVGLGAGVLAALASVAPHVVDGATVPWAELAVMLGAVFATGLAVAFAATAGILRVPLIPALRRE